MNTNEILKLKNRIIYILIIFLLIIGVIIILWQSNQNLKSELTNTKAKTEIKDTISANDKKLEAITNREAEYKQINEHQKAISINISGLETKQNELNKKKEENYENNISKSLSDIRDSYIQLGFPCTIISK